MQESTTSSEFQEIATKFAGNACIRYKGVVHSVDVMEGSVISDICQTLSRELSVDFRNIVLINRGTKYVYSSGVNVKSLLNSKGRADFILQFSDNHWSTLDMINWISKETGTVKGFIEEIPRRKKQLKLDYSTNWIRLGEIRSQLDQIAYNLVIFPSTDYSNQLKSLMQEARECLEN